MATFFIWNKTGIKTKRTNSVTFLVF